MTHQLPYALNLWTQATKHPPPQQVQIQGTDPGTHKPVFVLKENSKDYAQRVNANGTPLLTMNGMVEQCVVPKMPDQLTPSKFQVFVSLRLYHADLAAARSRTVALPLKLPQKWVSTQR